MKKRVLLGMSGGVDSSVSAILLKKLGYEVIGATMSLWKGEQESSCCSFSATYDAKRVCEKLEIPHYTFNMENEFKEHVVNNFINCYSNCQTPNPCVECNKYLKFGYFYKKALELECDYISTGHYAKVEFCEKYGQSVLKKSNAQKKDQTYFLYSIPKDVIPKIIFPLANYENKEEIRKIAEANELKIAKKPDSQEICFIPDNDYASFLIRNMNKLDNKGDIVTCDGQVIGKHKGLIYYTIGQRKGLGISYKEPLYVVKLDKEKNEVIVGTERNLYTKELYASNLNFLVYDDIPDKIRVKAKIRYRAKEAEALVEKISEDRVRVTFDNSQRAITPGQSIVFYDEDIVIGGGIIE